jgi:hypothetical protein
LIGKIIKLEQLIIPPEDYAKLAELLSWLSIDDFVRFFAAQADLLTVMFSVPNHFWQLCDHVMKQKDAEDKLAFFIAQPIELDPAQAGAGFSDMMQLFKSLPLKYCTDFIKQQKKIFGQLTCAQWITLLTKPHWNENVSDFDARQIIFFAEIPIPSVFDDLEQIIQLIQLVPCRGGWDPFANIVLLNNFYEKNKPALVRLFMTDLSMFIDFLIRFNVLENSLISTDHPQKRIMLFFDIAKEQIFALFRTPQMFQEAIERLYAVQHKHYQPLVFFTHSLRKLVEILEPKIFEFTQGWHSKSRYQLISVISEKDYSHPSLLKLIWSETEYKKCRWMTGASKQLNTLLVEELQLENDAHWTKSSFTVFKKLPDCIVRMRAVAEENKDDLSFNFFLQALADCCGLKQADSVSELIAALDKYRSTRGVQVGRSVAAAMSVPPTTVAHHSVNHL